MIFFSFVDFLTTGLNFQHTKKWTFGHMKHDQKVCALTKVLFISACDDLGRLLESTKAGTYWLITTEYSIYGTFNKLLLTDQNLDIFINDYDIYLRMATHITHHILKPLKL